ncbi:hypothetical protein TNCV_2192441 [Trichonephila clavipes]|nr:hypothetical protein TNCV_2192441 [Trichonephila clavipes]
MDFLTAYKTFCEGPIENTLPSSLDVSLGQQYLTQILKKSICSLLNEKGLKQPQTFAEEVSCLFTKTAFRLLPLGIEYTLHRTRLMGYFALVFQCFRMTKNNSRIHTNFSYE